MQYGRLPIWGPSEPCDRDQKPASQKRSTKLVEVAWFLQAGQCIEICSSQLMPFRLTPFPGHERGQIHQPWADPRELPIDWADSVICILCRDENIRWIEVAVDKCPWQFANVIDVFVTHRTEVTQGVSMGSRR